MPLKLHAQPPAIVRGDRGPCPNHTAGPRPVYAAVGLTMALGTLPVASLVGRQRLTSLKKVESCPSALRS